MSNLVAQMPLWLIMGIEIVAMTVLINEIKKQKGHLARSLTLLAIGFGFIIIFTVTSNTTLPLSINWILIGLFLLFIFAFFVDIFVFIYKTKLEPGKKRQSATIVFCVFMSYLILLSIGIGIKIFQKM